MSKDAVDVQEDNEPSAQELLINALAKDLPENNSDNDDVDDDVVEPELSADDLAIRDEAAKKGWVDKDEYDGPAGRWVDAGEFIRRGELIDKIQSQSKAYRKLQDQMKTMAAQMKRWGENQYMQELARLRAQRDSAMDNDDRAGADKANDDIAKLQAAQAQITDDDQTDDADDGDSGTQQNAQKYAQQWTEKNSWFNEDEDMRAMADGYANQYTNKEGEDATIEGLFAFVDKKMKKHIEAYNKTQSGDVDDDVDDEPEKAQPMSKVSGSPKAGRRSAASSQPRYTRADLDATQLSVLVDWILPNSIMTEKEYIDDLVKNGEVAKK